MSLFGWSLIRTKDLRKYEDNECAIQKLIVAHRWLTGWKDLDIIWEYIFNRNNFGGIELTRSVYAMARNTDEYGRKLDESKI